MSGRWLEQLMQDLRYALRLLRRNPGFTATAVLTLALCIGMNTAMFSVIDAVILQPLPYPDPDRIVWISDDCSANGYQSWDDCLMSRGDFVAWKQQAHSFEQMALVGNQDIALVYGGEATTERIGSIQGDFWRVLDAHPALGRLFDPSERDVVVLTWPLFARAFNGDPGAVGKTIELEGHTFRVVGVLTPHFQNLVPQALYAGDEIRDIAAYIPTVPGNEIPGAALKSTARFGPTPPWFRIIGKIKPGVSFDAAHAEMQTLFARTWKQHPKLWADRVDKSRLRFETLSQRLVGHARPTLAILFAAVLFVLFIGIANIANLLLARASTRETEIAIRAAVGAGRARIIRQFLAESVLLALLGGFAGVGLAAFSLAIIKHVGSPALPRLEAARINGSVMFFALAVSFLTGILFGLAPALGLSRRNLDESLKVESRASSVSATQLRLRGFLVAAEIALTLVLLVSAGLMLKSFRRMTSYPPGLEPNRILTLRVSLAGPYYDRQWPHQSAYLQQLFDHLGKLPGVQAFGIDCGQLNQALQVAGVRPSSSELAGAVRYVTPGYLKALHMPLLAGRWPTENEMLDDALVNESFVRRVASGVNVVGRRMQGTSVSATIVGVLADFKDFQLDVESQPQVYTGYQMMPVIREIRIALRTSHDPLSIVETVRNSVAGIDKAVPIFQIQTLAQELSGSVAPRRFNLVLLAIFAATALLLALVGIYGVIAYLVAQRTTEIGIRMALGASRRSILQLVVSQGMTMTLTGIAIGLLCAASATRVMSSMLYDVSPGDPATFVSVSAMITLTALLACIGPALRAALSDPIHAMK